MISFTDRMELTREFETWAKTNGANPAPFSVITWLLEVKGVIPANRIRTIKSRREVENEFLEKCRVPHAYFENDLLRTMRPELKKVAVIKEEPSIINPDCTSFTCWLKVVLPEDLSRLRFELPEVEK